MKKLIMICAIGLFFSCNTSAQKQKNEEFEVEKTEAEWRKELSSEEFYVLREEGTERAFTSPLNKEYGEGIYKCAGCGTPVFESEHKFDSGTGWPSFDRAIEGSVAYSTDSKLGYTRTEEHCATCGGHLGHVFNDGPQETTGKRHCINGVAVEFVPEQ